MDKDIAGGGPLLDQGVYDLSFHLGLLNDVPQLEKINSILLKSGLDNYDPGDLPYNVEESFVAMLDFSGGIKYFWERANHANVEVPNESRIYGTRGGIKLNFCTWDPNIIYFYDLDENNRARTTKIEISTGSQDDDFALIEHYIDVLDGKTEPVMPLERAGKHLDIIWRCYNEAKN